VVREAVPVAFWDAVSVAKERSSDRIASRIIAVWDVTTYVGIDKHIEGTDRTACPVRKLEGELPGGQN
jgi:hypothetical protein